MINHFEAMCDDFNYFTADIGNITPRWEDHQRTDGIVTRKMETIEFMNKEYKVTDRFILSFCSKFGIGTSIFYLFNPSEVFERIQMVHPRGRVRIAIKNDTCLAATAPDKPLIEFDTIYNILSSPKRKENIVHADYNNGVVKTVHIMNEAPWELNGEMFHQTFTLETPIDGYGLPSIYISLIRKSNNTILTADTKTFKSEIQLCKSSEYADIPMRRALDTFNNEEGFMALRQRLESAWTSWASVHECDSLLKVMSRTLSMKKTYQIFEEYFKMTGDVSKKYGIATEDSISTKKARLLPMDCKIIDLIFFNIQVMSSNHVPNHKPYTTWIGNLIDNEYDLEGSVTEG